jgi:hypothetical protein
MKPQPFSIYCEKFALATLCTRGFSSLVASTAAPIATGWSEPVPVRVTPAVDQHLFTAHPVSGLQIKNGSLSRLVPRPTLPQKSPE